MDKTPRPGGGWPIREEPLTTQMHLRLTDRMDAHVRQLARLLGSRGRAEAVRNIIEEHMEARNDDA